MRVIENQGISRYKLKRKGAKQYATQPESEHAGAHLTRLLRTAPSAFSSQNYAAPRSRPSHLLATIATIAEVY